MARTHELVVHGFHCDLYGHVNNARYLEFLEAGRWELLRDRIDVHDWHRRGWLFVIARIDISYRAAATLGDRLTVHSEAGAVGRRSATVQQRIENQDGRTVVEATITFVILDRDTQRPLPLDGEIRASLESLGHETAPTEEETR